MPNLSVRSGQIVKLHSDGNEKTQFLVKDLGESVVLLYVKGATISIAACPPSLLKQNVVHLLLFMGMFDSDDLDHQSKSQIFLASSSEKSSAFCNEICSVMDRFKIQYKIKQNFHDLHINMGNDIVLANANPAIDWQTLGDDQLPLYVTTFLTFTTGQNLADVSAEAILESFRTQRREGKDDSPEEKDSEKLLGVIDDLNNATSSALVNRQTSTSVAPPLKKNAPNTTTTTTTTTTTSTGINATNASKGSTPSLAKLPLGNESMRKNLPAQDSMNSAHRAETLAAVSKQLNNPEIYSVETWQRALVYLGNGRKVKCKLEPGAAALVLCDEATKILAITILGKEISIRLDEAAIAVEACWQSLTVAKERKKSETHGDIKSGNVVFQIIAPDSGSTLAATAVMAGIKATTAFNAIDLSSSTTHQYGLNTVSVLEIVNGKLSIKDFSNPDSMEPPYKAVVCSLRQSESRGLKILDFSNAKKTRFKDFWSVFDIPLNIELVSDMILELEMPANRCFVEIKKGYIVLYRYSPVTGKFALLQISSSDLLKYYALKDVTYSQYTLFNMFANVPLTATMAPTLFKLACKEATLGHGADSDACDKYIKSFKNVHDSLQSGAKVEFDGSSARTKYALHPLGFPEKSTYKAGASSKYLQFEIVNGDVKMSEVDKPAEGKTIRIPKSEDANTQPVLYRAYGMKVVTQGLKMANTDFPFNRYLQDGDISKPFTGVHSTVSNYVRA